MRRLALLLALVAVPPASAAASAPAAIFALAPVLAPADGTPFAVVVEARGAPGAALELRAWAGTPTTVLSRIHDGVAWVHGSRYVGAGSFDADGRWRGVVALSAEAAPANVSLLLRARVGGVTSAIESAPVALVARAGLVARYSADALAVARAGGFVLALGSSTPGPDGTAVPAARVLAPANATVANATAPPALALVAIGEGEAVVDSAGPTRGVCLAGRSVVCRDVPAGRSALPTPSGAPVRLVVWGEEAERVEPPARGVLRKEEGAWRLRPAGFEPRPFRWIEGDARVLAFTYPEGGLAAFDRVASGARERLDATVYTLESEDAAARLGEAARRGVRVRLLVEGAPVGGASAEQMRLLASLAAEGVEVRALKANGSVPARYPVLHAKTLVADSRVALVGSENWNPSSLRTGPTGNRGWGIVVESPEVGAAFAEVFEHDWSGRDAVRVEARGGASARPSVDAFVQSGMEFSGPTRIAVVLAPDHAASALPRILRAANRSIDAELLSVDVSWSDGANPLAEATLEAASRGARVRMLLDGSVRDNRRAAEWLAERAGEAPLEARIDRTSRTLHNKGFVVDGRLAFVGSVNWGEASVTRNREVGLLLDDRRVGAYFAARFAELWDPADAAREAPGFAPLAALAASAIAFGKRGRRQRGHAGGQARSTGVRIGPAGSLDPSPDDHDLKRLARSLLGRFMSTTPRRRP